MKLFDYIIIGLILFFFVVALKFLIKQNKKGGCAGCSSNGCSNCKHYDSNKNDIREGK